MELLYFIGCFLQPVCLPVPEMATVLWGSLRLGAGKAFFLGIAGTVLGIVFMYCLSAHIRRYLETKPTVQRKIREFQFYIRNYCFIIIGMLFIIPILPDEIICIGAALSGLSLYKLIPVAALSKVVSIGMVVWSDEIAHIIPLNQYCIIGVEIVLLLTAAQLFKRKHRFGGETNE